MSYLTTPENSSNNLETISLPSAPECSSDGDQNAWPKEAYWRKQDDWLYRHKLAMMWMEKDRKAVKGKQYILEKLPDQYVLLDRPRFSSPKIRDKFLYGHPSGSCFNSPKNFFPHFYWLVSGKSGPCPCECCKKKRPPTSASGSGTSTSTTHHYLGPGRWARGRPPKGAPKLLCQRRILDSEGVPDIFRETVTRLSKENEIDEPISEPRSMDWRAENKLVREHIVRVGLQGSYIPRVGEIVLWIPQLNGELKYNEQTRSYQIYSPKKSLFIGNPVWRAGTVSEVPEKDPVVLDDLIEPTQKKWEVNYSGFRVETFPDPNSDDKSASLQYQYVHIYVLRPFNSWPVWLEGLPQREWHPSIKHAMTVMSSVCMINKYHFKGVWPNASIHCRGMFLGPEMILVGDTVRLKPKGATVNRLSSVTDVMVIKRIEFRLNSCIEDLQSPNLAKSYSVRVRGNVYSLAPNRAYRKPGEYSSLPLNRQEVIDAFQQVGMSEYGAWYRTHGPSTSVEISHDMIIGRCYEPTAMELLFGHTSLDFDLFGMLASREWSRKTDNRMEDGQDWFWADYRVQALSIDTLNGDEVGRYSEAREPRMWKGVLNILDGTATQADWEAAKLPRNAGRQPGRPTKSQFAEVQKMSSLVSSGLNMDLSANASSSDDETVNTSSEEESDKDEMDLVAVEVPATNTPPGVTKFGHGDGGVKDRDDEDDENDWTGDPAVLIQSFKPLPIPIRGNDNLLVKNQQFKRPRLDL
ncbi:conserved hypothetical protein [Talaromyces stipitatus ATCC 10500]|uniref:Cryptic loci regulator 2 N-terminal domain-containing protein n=1 Tax=Talaromyces stipitatus (strain ATCC 10500 / CBS 375.48 / QM 6759 / NRRL 1006) TaxID=441959 RepID=B8MGR0_TALSN|nr:uncharacterized protein TSTA_018780 [Talaromyces stipitatus ATCC 10500]EED16811.1 conserved hypothetical protein [Talaromyces stipitatus ATCC 10500]